MDPRYEFGRVGAIGWNLAELEQLDTSKKHQELQQKTEQQKTEQQKTKQQKTEDKPKRVFGDWLAACTTPVKFKRTLRSGVFDLTD